MAETLALTTPVLAKAGITTLRPTFIALDRLRASIVIQLTPWDGSNYILDGRKLEYQYDGTTTPTGLTLLVALNKANLSTQSLEKRVMTQLIADHPELAGSVNGAPD